MTGRMPDFQAKEVELRARRVILIVDEDLGAMSVTNGVEQVLDALTMPYLHAKVFYRDSEAQWDELKIGLDGEFAGFGPMTPEMRSWCADQWAST
jgi:hypothetical protein